VALTEADLGALYNKANSPNPSPYFNSLLTFPLTITSRAPLSVRVFINY
jgi:hypothetical protein